MLLFIGFRQRIVTLLFMNRVLNKYCAIKNIFQAGSYCFCGQSYGAHGEDESGATCSYTCRGSNIQTCGGSWRNNVYDVTGTTTHQHHRSKDCTCALKQKIMLIMLFSDAFNC